MIELRSYINKLSANELKLFPVKENEKLPAYYEGWKKKATSQIEALDTAFMLDARGFSTFNLGVRCGVTSKDGVYLFVVDVDVSKDKKGLQSLVELELNGCEMSETFTVHTPTGGIHYYYFTNTPFTSGVNSIAQGIDHRCEGGFVVGPGSRVNGGYYTIKNDVDIAPIPAWLDELMQRRNLTTKTVLTKDEVETATKSADYDTKYAMASEFLKVADISIEGEGGNHNAFKVFAKLKDFDLTVQDAVMLADKYWNPRCEPPWSLIELTAVARNAYRYGSRPSGSAFESVNAFSDIKPLYSDGSVEDNIVHDFNKRYAVLTDFRPTLRVGEFKEDGTLDNDYSLTDFATLTRTSKAQLVHETTGAKKLVDASELWLASPKRRQVKVVFDMDLAKTEFTPESTEYNMFRGFSFEPCSYDEASPDARDALLTLQEHIFENVCSANQELSDLFWAWMAQTIAAPKKKLITVPCLISDARGSGKSIISNMLVNLMDPYATTIIATTLVDNFNSVLSNKKFVGVEEMYRSTSKAFNSAFRDIVSSPRITIKEKYKVERVEKNYINMMVTSNYVDCVEAHTSERRFAVFDVKPNWVGSSKKWDSLDVFANPNQLDNGLLGGELLNDKWLNYNTSRILKIVDNSYNKELSLDPVRSFISEALGSGLLENCVTRSYTKEGRCSILLNTTLLRERFMQDRKNHRDIPIQAFNRVVSTCVIPGGEVSRRFINGERVNCIILPAYVTRKLVPSDNFKEYLKEYFMTNYKKDTGLHPDVYDDEHDIVEDIESVQTV
jgi:hypothetical protein